MQMYCAATITEKGFSLDIFSLNIIHQNRAEIPDVVFDVLKWQ